MVATLLIFQGSIYANSLWAALSAEGMPLTPQRRRYLASPQSTGDWPQGACRRPVAAADRRGGCGDRPGLSGQRGPAQHAHARTPTRPGRVRSPDAVGPDLADGVAHGRASAPTPAPTATPAAASAARAG
ncbi:MAG TPA: hypothetical protein VNI34_09445 [Candidatus Nitrosotalea sp.]|nr:hypothetical protein [Candidatus Nitrosotalea sp.]